LWIIPLVQPASTALIDDTKMAVYQAGRPHRTRPAKPVTGSPSPRLPNGSFASVTPTTKAASTPSSPGRTDPAAHHRRGSVGYIPFEAEAANLFFQLISARYEYATVIVTSNKPFGRWGETFGDATVAAAMIDRLAHHASTVPTPQRISPQYSSSMPSCRFRPRLRVSTTLR
jgi:IstB-like ATP binding protein